VAVLAHPLQYGFPKSDLEKFVKAAAEAGVTGLEIYYTGYTENDRNKLFDLAEKHSLLPTGGSDFHGDNKPGIQLGSGDGALSVPAYMLAMLAMSQYR
jgi:predicted metal-dependent phosphoesterase TrpH